MGDSESFKKNHTILIWFYEGKKEKRIRVLLSKENFKSPRKNDVTKRRKNKEREKTDSFKKKCSKNSVFIFTRNQRHLF